MAILFKIINESIQQAIQQLLGNRLRSFLSLLGISIGIFCIIGVLSAVELPSRRVYSVREESGEGVTGIGEEVLIDRLS